MAHRLISHVVQINLQATYATAGELLHVFHAQSPNVLPTHEECVTVAEAIDAWVPEEYAPLCNTAVQFNQVTVTSIAEIDGPQHTMPLPYAGTNSSGDFLPPSVTLALKFSTGVAGRRKRGRRYLFPATTDQLLDADHWKAAHVAASIAAWENLRAALLALDIPMCVASHVAEAGYEIQSILATDNIIDSQRRRLLGRGR